MEYLKKMIDTVRTTHIFDQSILIKEFGEITEKTLMEASIEDARRSQRSMFSPNRQAQLKEHFAKLVEKAHFFLFHQTGPRAFKIEKELGLQLDLPFSTCIFERIGGPLYQLDVGDQLMRLPYGTDPQLTEERFVVLVNELAPRKYEFFTFELMVPVDTKHHERAGVSYSTSDAPVIGVTETTELLINDIGSSQLGREAVRERVKLGTGNYKRTHTIRTLIHVSKGTPQVVVGHRDVDWTHRWEVRGHWRNIDATAIGKNRDGEYGVVGMTWVKEHTKGPEELPVVNKLRVVH